MTDGETLLVRLLASTDAVWLPLRDWAGWGASAIYEAQQEYPSAGVPWQSGGTGEAEWKAAQRLLSSLVADGMLTLHRPHVKAIRCRLSDKGEDVARALSGLPPVYAGWRTLLEVERRTTRPPKLLTDVWIAEADLAGERPPEFTEGRWLACVEEEAMPALSRGWLEARSDCHGHVRYRVTDEGRRAIEKGKAPGFGIDLPVDALARATYYDLLAQARARLTSGAAPRPELGFLPLPVSIENVPLGA